MRRIIHAVKGWIKGTTHKGRGAAIVYVYPAGKEAQNSELGANDQITILRRLSTFSDKEAIPVTVIFPGRPSRKIPDGTTQGTVQVRYATGDQLRKVVVSCLAGARDKHSPVLATNHPEMEKMAGSEHVRHIRASTFEETLDSVCGPLRREQPNPPRRQPPPPAQQAPKPPSTAPADSGETPPAAAQDQAPAPEAAPDAPPPSVKTDTVPRRLQRHEPSAKKVIKDQSILDLIDPL